MKWRGAASVGFRGFSGNTQVLLIRAALLFCWIGVGFFLTGSCITFVPGAEQEWFTFTAACLLGGLFSRSWLARVAVVILVALSIAAAIDGRRRGIAYRQRL